MRKINFNLSFYKTISFAFLFITSIGCISAQNEPLPARWDLQTCIQYALKHNIQIKQTEAQRDMSVVDTKLAKSALLPSVSASIGQNLSNSPFGSDDETSVTSTSGSYDVKASWTLYNGGKLQNNIRQADLNHQIAELNISESKNDIRLAIIQDYMQILYANESVKTFENAVELSAAQVERTKALLEAGSVSKIDVAQWESQQASDKYQLTNARVALDEYKLQLKQLLELDYLESMDLILTEPAADEVLTVLPDKMTVFNQAMVEMPQIKSSQLETQVSQIGITNAQAGYMPSVSFQAGIGTGNYYEQSFNFGKQLQNNWNNILGLSVSIPIFSNREVKSAVEKAQISVETSRLSELSVKKVLYGNIESAWLNAFNSQAQYMAANEKMKSSRTSYDLMNEQFNLGITNTVELLTEKNSLISAQQAQIQAKYMALLNRKVLDFYRGL